MKHAEVLQGLLPPAAVDPKGAAMAVELAADGATLDAAMWSAGEVLVEADPRSTVPMLADWERVYGLPGACFTFAEQSIAARRSALLGRVRAVGGQSMAFFIALAAALGYSITITEWHPFTTEMDTESIVTDERWAFYWQVNSELVTMREETTEDDSEMPLAEWGNELLECAINHLKPAHTGVIFSYSDSAAVTGGVARGTIVFDMLEGALLDAEFLWFRGDGKAYRVSGVMQYPGTDPFGPAFVTAEAFEVTGNPFIPEGHLATGADWNCPEGTVLTTDPATSGMDLGGVSPGSPPWSAVVGPGGISGGW